MCRLSASPAVVYPLQWLEAAVPAAVLTVLLAMMNGTSDAVIDLPARLRRVLPSDRPAVCRWVSLVGLGRVFGNRRRWSSGRSLVPVVLDVAALERPRRGSDKLK